MIISSLAIPDTGWHHISVALDPVGDTVRFTLDDQSDVQSTTASGTINSGPLLIGAHYNSSGVIDSSFDGLIDELSITNGFLAISDLQPLAGIPAPGPFQIHSHDLEPGGGAKLTFESSENYLYEVQSSSTLESDSWTTVRSFIPGAVGSTTTVIEDLPLPAGDRGFYRIVGRFPSE